MSEAAVSGGVSFALVSRSDAGDAGCVVGATSVTWPTDGDGSGVVSFPARHWFKEASPDGLLTVPAAGEAS